MKVSCNINVFAKIKFKLYSWVSDENDILVVNSFLKHFFLFVIFFFLHCLKVFYLLIFILFNLSFKNSERITFLNWKFQNYISFDLRSFHELYMLEIFSNGLW